MYSQGEEEEIILKYFKEEKGFFLDVGAADGISLSNSRALYERGWKGILLEPSIRFYKKLCDLYKNDSEIIVINKALGSSTGEMVFYETENIEYTLGSSSNKHCELFKSYGPFLETKVNSISWNEFITLYPYKYDFITIDTEGMDYEILQLINLKEVGNKMICVEWVYNREEIESYLCSNNYEIVYKSGENIIGVKQC